MMNDVTVSDQETFAINPTVTTSKAADDKDNTGSTPYLSKMNGYNRTEISKSSAAIEVGEKGNGDEETGNGGSKSYFYDNDDEYEDDKYDVIRESHRDDNTRVSEQSLKDLDDVFGGTAGDDDRIKLSTFSEYANDYGEDNDLVRNNLDDTFDATALTTKKDNNLHQNKAQSLGSLERRQTAPSLRMMESSVKLSTQYEMEDNASIDHDGNNNDPCLISKQRKARRGSTGHVLQHSDDGSVAPTLKNYFRSANNVVNEIKWPSIQADVRSNREQVSVRRLEHEMNAMSRKERTVLLLKRRGSGCDTTTKEADGRMTRMNETRRQYHITSRRKHQDTNRCTRFFDHFGMQWRQGGLSSDDYTETSDDKHWCFNWSLMIGEFIIWTFRTSFMLLFWVAFVIYMFIVLIFTAMFMAIGNRNPGCFAGSGFADFHDAFALSWTTLSTVGYGYTSPENAKVCGFLHFLCCAEAFIGVLYAGLFAAVLFGKVTRIQSHAHVIFSDPIVVQFGRALLNSDTSKRNSLLRFPRLMETKSPCPVMEFRVANRLFGVHGGEIMNATISCVAISDQSSIKTEVKREAQGLMRSIRSMHHIVDVDAVEKDPQAPTKRIFARVDILSSEHPFFKRVWTAKHILNEQSPLLTDVAKKRIRDLGGFWPGNCNTWQEVRKSIKFDQLIVTFEGVSNVSASTVYAQKVYELIDVNLGYEFANMLYRSDRGIGMDMNVLSDIVEQTGGGSEPLD